VPSPRNWDQDTLEEMLATTEFGIFVFPSDT